MSIARESHIDKLWLDSRVPASMQEFLRPEHTALIMWDFQKGLAGRAPNVGELASAAKILVDAADRAGVLVAWSQHVFPPLDMTPGPWLLWLMRKQGVDCVSDIKPMLQKGMAETDFLDDLRPQDHHLVLEKSQPSLFFDTPFDNRLKVRGIRTVVIAGFATDIGVEFTARHATAEGYFAFVAEDATGAYTLEGHERSLVFLRGWGHVAKAAEIAAVWTTS